MNQTIPGIPAGRRTPKLKHPQFLVTVEGMKPREARVAIEQALVNALGDGATVKQVTAASVRKLAEQWS